MDDQRIVGRPLLRLVYSSDCIAPRGICSQPIHRLRRKCHRYVGRPESIGGFNDSTCFGGSSTTFRFPPFAQRLARFRPFAQPVHWQNARRLSGRHCREEIVEDAPMAAGDRECPMRQQINQQRACGLADGRRCKVCRKITETVGSEC